MASGRARPTMLVSSYVIGRISIERHTALIKSHSVKMAYVQCNNSIHSLKETPFSRRTNKDKLTTKQLGPPRPNVSIQQVFYKGGHPKSKNWYERKSWLTWSVFLYTTVTFHRFHSVNVRFLH